MTKSNDDAPAKPADRAPKWGDDGTGPEPGGAARLTRLVHAPEPVVRAASAVDGAVGAAAGAVEAAAGAATRIVPGAQPVVRAASAVGGTVEAAVGAAGRRWDERPGARVRRLRRLARHPLAYLYDVHPEARRAIPKELGIRAIDVDDIVGTAVGGATQRGGDFLPLRAFRSRNWAGRWERLRLAVESLAILPPIDVVKYADGYWVLDGHNRVAAALYAGQIEVDANVTELVPPGGVSSERPGSLASTVASGRAVRTVASGRPAAPIVEDQLLIRPEPEPDGE
jgi:hypothetical protein